MIHEPHYVHVDYLTPIVQTHRLADTVKQMALALRQHDFDALAFTGVSGMMLGAPLALELDKTMLVVRKDVYSHSKYTVEGDYGARRYIIVDDCVCTGATFKRIQKKISEAVPAAKCLGLMAAYNVLGSLMFPGGSSQLVDASGKPL